MIAVGRISGLFGAHGWVKVFSYTEPRERIVAYRQWYVRRGEQWQPLAVLEGGRRGKNVVARLDGVEDREAARALIGADIALERRQLPDLEQGEYYWADLEGLRVVTVGGIELGTVDHLIETGSNDVLVVRNDRERLIPYIRDQVVVEVDLEGGVLHVDWDPEF